MPQITAQTSKSKFLVVGLSICPFIKLPLMILMYPSLGMPSLWDNRWGKTSVYVKEHCGSLFGSFWDFIVQYCSDNTMPQSHHNCTAINDYHFLACLLLIPKTSTNKILENLWETKAKIPSISLKNNDDHIIQVTDGHLGVNSAN